MNRKLLYITGLVCIALVLGILNFFNRPSPQPQTQSNRLQVITSFYPLYFFASEIGKDKAEVINITPPGTEPHDFDPPARELARIENSDLLVLNGEMETWGEKIRKNLEGKKVKTVVAGEGLFVKELAEENKTVKDPHIWLNPKLAQKEVGKITAGYISVDPANGAFYKENEKQLLDRLSQLDENYKLGLSNCMSKNIITSHTAFSYMAEAYGLQQIPVSGISPDEEPSAQKIAEVADFAKRENVKYIFFEKLVSPKLSETIANEIGAQTLVLDPIEGISDDDIRQGKNYLTVMQDNLKNLQIALQCSI